MPRTLGAAAIKASPAQGVHPVKIPFARARSGVFAVVGLIAIAVPADAADMEDPLSLFAKMMPVFGHPRCTNCHGGMDPSSRERDALAAVNHPGGVRGQPECPECHNATQEIRDAWRVPRHDLFGFLGKNAKQMCEMQADKVRQVSRPTYYRHLETDALITQSFDGMAGGARDPDPPAKPPMSRGDFLRAGRNWLDAGASCGGWKGEITQEETFGSNYTYPMPDFEAPSRVHVNETAARNFKVNREGGETRVTVTASGAAAIVQTLHLTGPNGPCTSIATSDSSWRTTTPANAHGVLEIRIKDDGSYTIRFGGPAETGNGNTTGSGRNDCGIPLPPPVSDPPADFEWNAWQFTIRCPSDHAICQLYDPDNRRVMGTMTRTIVNQMDAADPQSWLTTAPVGISRSDDGTSIPVTVTTTWDLTLED
jgi:hypothetical protein